MRGKIQVADIEEAQNLLERAVNLTLGDDPVQEFLQKCWRDLEHEKEEQAKKAAWTSLLVNDDKGIGGFLNNDVDLHFMINKVGEIRTKVQHDPHNAVLEQSYTTGDDYRTVRLQLGKEEFTVAVFPQDVIRTSHGWPYVVKP